jgi:hypothetical protein
VFFYVDITINSEYLKINYSGDLIYCFVFKSKNCVFRHNIAGSVGSVAQVAPDGIISGAGLGANMGLYGIIRGGRQHLSAFPGRANSRRVPVPGHQPSRTRTSLRSDLLS